MYKRSTLFKNLIGNPRDKNKSFENYKIFKIVQKNTTGGTGVTVARLLEPATADTGPI